MKAGDDITSGSRIGLTNPCAPAILNNVPVNNDKKGIQIFKKFIFVVDISAKRLL